MYRISTKHRLTKLVDVIHEEELFIQHKVEYLSVICFSGRDSGREGQREAGKSDPSLQKKKLGYPGGTEHSKELVFFPEEAIFCWFKT